MHPYLSGFNYSHNMFFPWNTSTLEHALLNMHTFSHSTNILIFIFFLLKCIFLDEEKNGNNASLLAYLQKWKANRGLHGLQGLVGVGLRLLGVRLKVKITSSLVNRRFSKSSMIYCRDCGSYNRNFSVLLNVVVDNHALIIAYILA